MYVQEKGRLLMEHGKSSQSTQLTVKRKNKNQVNKKGKDKVPPPSKHEKGIQVLPLQEKEAH